MKNSKAWPGKQLRRRYASLRDCVIFMFVSQHGSCQVWNAPAVQRTHGFVMIGAVHECIITAVLPLLVRGTRSRNRLRGKADSPSDGLRPSSAQRSICREDCAWTNRIAPHLPPTSAHPTVRPRRAVIRKTHPSFIAEARHELGKVLRSRSVSWASPQRR